MKNLICGLETLEKSLMNQWQNSACIIKLVISFIEVRGDNFPITSNFYLSTSIPLSNTRCLRTFHYLTITWHFFQFNIKLTFTHISGTFSRLYKQSPKLDPYTEKYVNACYINFFYEDKISQRRKPNYILMSQMNLIKN